jgi:hypothetical protein
MWIKNLAAWARLLLQILIDVIWGDDIRPGNDNCRNFVAGAKVVQSVYNFYANLGETYRRKYVQCISDTPKRQHADTPKHRSVSPDAPFHRHPGTPIRFRRWVELAS